MLRHLLTSTARTSSRSLSAKSNASSVFMSSQRMASDKSGTRSRQEQEEWNKRFNAFLYGALTASFVCMMGTVALPKLGLNALRKEIKNSCGTGTILKPAAPASKNEDAAGKEWWREREVKVKVKEADLTEHGVVASSVLRPWFLPEWLVGKGTVMVLPAVAVLIRPNGSPSTDYKEICELLKLPGIHVEQSEEGARLGLAELGVRQLRRGLVRHCQKKCGCFTSSATKVTPPTSNAAS